MPSREECPAVRQEIIDLRLRRRGDQRVTHPFNESNGRLDLHYWIL
jgi:hypothetical protein